MLDLSRQNLGEGDNMLLLVSFLRSDRLVHTLKLKRANIDAKAAELGVAQRRIRELEDAHQRRSQQNQEHQESVQGEATMYQTRIMVLQEVPHVLICVALRTHIVTLFHCLTTCTHRC